MGGGGDNHKAAAATVALAKTKEFIWVLHEVNAAAREDRVPGGLAAKV